MRRPSRTGAADKTWKRGQRASRRWAFYGIAAGLLVGGIAFAPATWLASGLHRASGERFLLAEAQGSVWSGSAVAVLQGGPDSRDAAALPGRLHWRLSPRWNGLALTLTQACCLRGDLRLRLAVGWNGLSVHWPAQPDGVGQWPAQWLGGLGTPWNTLQLGGTIRLVTPGFSVQRDAGRLRLAGALDVELINASSRVSPIEPLGTYRLAVRTAPGAADQAAMTLDTLDGALRLTGAGQWTGTGLRFRGEARAAPGQEAGLANLLNIIGRRQGALSVISIG